MVDTCKTMWATEGPIIGNTIPATGFLEKALKKERQAGNHGPRLQTLSAEQVIIYGSVFRMEMAAPRRQRGRCGDDFYSTVTSLARAFGGIFFFLIWSIATASILPPRRKDWKARN